MKRVLTFIAFLLMLYCCIGCGPSYHLKRASYHIMQAKAKGAKIESDTVRREMKFEIPPMKFETVLEPLYKSDGTTVFIQRSSTAPEVKTEVQIKWRDKCDSTCIESLRVKTDIPKQEVKKDVPVEVNTNIVPPKNHKWWIWLTVGICVGFILCFAIFLWRPNSKQ